MKKLMLTTAAFLAVLYIFSGCADSGIKDTAAQTLGTEPSPVVSDEPLFTLSPAPAPEQPGETQQPEQGMYSSYAYMRRFDPQSGIAQFDYFDVLTGSDAVNYLINCEGYCSLVAQEEVAKYEESDFLEVNPDGALWDIDLRQTGIKLLYKADGSFSEQAAQASIEDVAAIWDADKSLLLQKHFYYITVDEATGQVLSIEQLAGF